MNTLFLLKCALGDTVNVSRFIFDYHQEFPNENLYVACKLSFVNDLFKSCSFCHIFDNNKNYDKIYDYDLAKFDGLPEIQQMKDDNKITMQDVPYLLFKRNYNLDISQNTKHIPIELDDYQKSKIASEKPICLVNGVAQYFGLDARFLGITKLQKVIDYLHDKIDFISIGNIQYGFLQNKELKNVKINLINKTSVYELLHLIYNARFVLTSESGIYHISQIVSPNIRDIFITAGNRLSYDYNHYSTQNVKIHWIKPKYKNCDYDLNKKLCHFGALLKRVNGVDFGAVCKTPVICDNELVSCCQADIQVDEIINEILGELNK